MIVLPSSCVTPGYGHQVPTTRQGRVFCLLYALLGVPLNAILVGSLGAVFRRLATRLHKRITEDMHFKPNVFLEAAAISFTFFAVFLPIPALIFSYLENEDQGFLEGDWSFLNALYFTFITLSTIGFGDMVPGKSKPAQSLNSPTSDRHKNTKIPSELLRYFYLGGIILWIILGMGYIVGVVEIISNTLRAGG